MQINLYYSEDFDALKNSILSSGVVSGRDKKEKGTFISLSENPQFVLLKMAPRAGLEPATYWLTASRYCRLSYRGISILTLVYKRTY